MEAPTTISFGHVPSFDGLRGVAVAAVVVYHYVPRALPGGFIGVDVFFVLSGFLLSSLLVREVNVTGSVQLGRFFVRRTRRLLPAMVLVMLALALYAATWAEDNEIDRLRRHGVASLGYFANWLFVSDGTTYTDSIVGASPLRHVWSLSIEEQFYVLLAGGLFCVAKLGRRRKISPARHRRLVAIGAGVLTTMSAVLMLVLSLNGASTERLYFGLDTRAQALLIGVVAGAVLVGSPVRSSALASRVAVIGAVVLAVVAATAHEDSTWMFRGGFLLTALGAVAVITCGPAHPIMRRVLENRLLVLLGVISYGVYLWHWPLLVILDEARLGFGGLARTLVLIALTLALSTASYRLVERPIRQGSLGRRLGRPALMVGPAATLSAGLLLVAATVTPARLGVDTRADGSPASTLEIGATIPIDPITTDAIGATSIPSGTSGPVTTVTDPVATDPGGTVEGSEVPAETSVPSSAAAATDRPLRVVAFGDSVMHTMIGGALTPRYDAIPWTPAASVFAHDRIEIAGAARVGCSYLPGTVVFRELDQECENWRTALADAIVADSAGPADAVMLMLANDLEDRFVSGDLVVFGSTEFNALLEDFFDEVREIAPAPTRIVILIPPPRLDPSTRKPVTDRPVAFARFVEDYRAAHSGIEIIDVYEALCPGGDCDRPIGDFDPQWRFDGVHFSRNGAIWMGNWLTPQLEALLR